MATTKQMTARIHLKWRYSAHTRAVKPLFEQIMFTQVFNKLSSKPSNIIQMTRHTKIAITYTLATLRRRVIPAYIPSKMAFKGQFPLS